MFYFAEGPARGEIDLVVLMVVDLAVADLDASLREAMLRYADIRG